MSRASNASRIALAALIFLFAFLMAAAGCFVMRLTVAEITAGAIKAGMAASHTGPRAVRQRMTLRRGFEFAKCIRNIAVAHVHHALCR